MSESRTRWIEGLAAAGSALLLGIVLSLGGCADEERKILDVETPGTDIEIRENFDTGEVTIDGDLHDEDLHDESESHTEEQR